ncbi:Glucosamine-6-phosphate isomerase (Glucosamine-6-phosphate deaminase) (GNPDA) (GlcN6P deaminase) [Entomophthora muscae]|uniref:Glucosamine-6-phosphate isomerase (Glucosamine-6-phosphate deaminase) (GNPDA) (GlcN6P deaminase) n=1 Tax=Entomophthora muscae TaxID=34485 RepID=A0ACC2SMB7_9FUNG|nr:Glucosamine-6-phosphate isomerase (Glucosamine-6-phosphate deaminase) (GNPDA) (GlcN6P deaminase) [Entomophthora muscae]
MKILLLLSVVVSDPYAVWPKPEIIFAGDGVAKVHEQFKFTTTSQSQELKVMMDRYEQQIRTTKWLPIVPWYQAKGEYKDILKAVDIKVESDDARLNETTDESYSLVLNHLQAIIEAKSIYGARHAMETLYQMVQYQHNNRLISKWPITIHDKPKFKHRGLLLDTSHNYFPVKDILRTIKTMARNKMNVFHWHIVDSPSWPFQSEKYPLLSQYGTVFIDQIYTFKDIETIVEFATTHGVRVIPEFQTHSSAMDLAYPELMPCKKNYIINTNQSIGKLYPYDDQPMKLVKGLMDEFIKLFPDSRLHITDTQAKQKCWENNSTESHISTQGTNLDNLIDKLVNETLGHATKQKSLMVGEEMVKKHKANLPTNTLVLIRKIAWSAGTDDFKFIISNEQYWDLAQGQAKSWKSAYSFDPMSYLKSNQIGMVVGGEVSLFSAQVDSVNLDAVLWPKSSAVAEVLWTGAKVKNMKGIIPTNTTARLSNFRFHLLSHGVKAKPIQSIWCVLHPGPYDSDSPNCDEDEPAENNSVEVSQEYDGN